MNLRSESNLNEGFNNNNNITQPNLTDGIVGISQFGGGFGPNYGGVAAANSLISEQQKPGLSLWLDQANSQLNAIGNALPTHFFCGKFANIILIIPPRVYLSTV